MLGSANLAGAKLSHVLSGNLTHQIEHHLFPDLPARRYPELAVEVREICQRYGLPYNTGRLSWPAVQRGPARSAGWRCRTEPRSAPDRCL